MGTGTLKRITDRDYLLGIVGRVVDLNFAVLDNFRRVDVLGAVSAHQLAQTASGSIGTIRHMGQKILDFRGFEIISYPAKFTHPAGNGRVHPSHGFGDVTLTFRLKHFR